MMMARAAAILTLTLSSGGCLAKTAIGVVTAPVKVAGKAVDLVTTSQSEADRAYGRKARQAEVRAARERRAADRRCRHDPDQCLRYESERGDDDGRR